MVPNVKMICLLKEGRIKCSKHAVFLLQTHVVSQSMYVQFFDVLNYDPIVSYSFWMHPKKDTIFWTILTIGRSEHSRLNRPMSNTVSSRQPYWGNMTERCLWIPLSSQDGPSYIHLCKPGTFGRFGKRMQKAKLRAERKRHEWSTKYNSQRLTG